MNLYYHKAKHWLLISLAGLFGINVSCVKEVSQMYGVPQAEFEVKGIVTNTNGDPIQGIEVTTLFDSKDTTDANGCYKITRTTDVSMECYASFHDIDPNQYGSYQDAVAHAEFDHNNSAEINITLKRVSER